ncbi:MRCKG [Enterospora canceri]|uniref:non-specific serine/threonine protein kinase n=1 Tax=Enterospora canceri TaxID=1081671 RepID=A0A1Y1S6T0_9MICR|nr:MRCKG [Enterospora canceri]
MQNTKELDLSSIIDLTELYAKECGASKYANVYQNKTKIRDYRIVCNLAKGGFGEVFVAEKDGRIYAVKRVSKDMCKKNQNSTFFMVEKEIMTQSTSPWIVCAHECIQDETYLYFVMDFIPGGDLLGYLSKMDVIEEEQIAFYAAEILLALEDLHALGYVHRDLKPDNVFIGRDGHILLGDFGSAARLIDGFAQSRIPVGTPDYMCRDVLIENTAEGASYTASIDLWTLGILIYEMATGEPPFYSQTVSETYNRITALDFKPISGAETLVDLISKLICKAEDRLTAEQIKSHPFFKDTDFSRIRSTKPPFIPTVSSDSDVSNFIVDGFKLEESSIKGGFRDFVGFTYDPKYARIFGESLISKLGKQVVYREKFSASISERLNCLTVDMKNLEGIKDEIAENEKKLIEKEKEFDRFVDTKMMEIDDLNITIDDLTNEKEKKQGDLSRSQAELDKIENELLHRRDDSRVILDELSKKRVVLDSIQRSLKQKSAQMEMKDYSTTRTALDDLRSTLSQIDVAGNIAAASEFIRRLLSENSLLISQQRRHQEETASETTKSMEQEQQMKKQLRGLKTEMKEHQARIDQEVTMRLHAEEENRRLCSDLKALRAKSQTKTTYALKNAMTNKTLRLTVHGSTVTVDATPHDSNQIYVREIRNGEFHHFPYKKRALCLVIHCLRDYSAHTASSSPSRSPDSVSTDIKKEEQILDGLRELDLLIRGDANIKAQISGSTRRLESLQNELRAARSASSSSPSSNGHLIKFNNHRFREHTVGKGSLCDHCNDVMYGLVNQAHHCSDCHFTVHKACHLLGDVSCELQQAINKGVSLTVVARNIEEKEQLLKMGL